MRFITRDLPRVLVLAVLTSMMGAPLILQGRSPQSAPLLSDAGGTVVHVSNEAQLQAAVRRLASNTTIVLAPGTYQLTRTLTINGTFSNIAVRGATNNPDDVVLRGRGMSSAASGNVRNGISVGGGVQGIGIANLTLRDFSADAIVLNTGTTSPHIYHVHLLDAGGRFIRSYSGGVDNGVVEYSVIEYSTTARDAGAGGVEVQGGANWIFRHNLFRNINRPAGELAGPALQIHGFSTNTITEANTFLNTSRAIAYGVENQAAGFDHQGGVIRNNIIFRSNGQAGEAAIGLADSPDTKILNNTAFLSGTYATPIEYRFAKTTGVTIENNLIDGFIFARDGATGTERNNLTSATADMFVDAIHGDLHLAPTASAAIGRGVAVAEVTDDFEGNARSVSGASDIGAIEFRQAVVKAPIAPAAGATTAAATTAATTAAVSADATATTTTIWAATTTPSRIETSDGSAVELGVRFRSDVNGIVTGLRFYKGTGNTGTHVGNLWSTTGTLLASAMFTNETASGWQQVTFATPVAITANTTYIASYHTNVGNYAVNDSYFRAGRDNPPLHALADGIDGPNGIYRYSATSVFPNQTYQAANYWVDVVFTTSATGDTTAPTVAVTAPVNGATVSGNAVTVTATASDNVGVAGVQFRLDGANWGAEATTSPYTATWDTTKVTNGSHTWSATARDAAGNTTTAATITVTVNNADTTAPTVSMTAPAGGATVSGSAVTVSASASDNVGVAGVQFKLDGANLGAEDAASPYSSTWNTTTVANGTHTLTAVARDAAGNTTTAAAVTVTVSNTTPDTTAPTVSVTAPAGGATVSGSAVTVSASAADNVGVVGVQFKLDGANLGAEDAASPYSSTWNTTTVVNGTHTLTAVARDAAGNATTAAAVTVTVSNGSTSLTLWSPSATPSRIETTDTDAGEFGVKFRAAVAGTIDGLRFYKGVGNTGTHVGRLWTGTGTLLATATFTNETASGWQQVRFSAPVAISANTMYVASYRADHGQYAVDEWYFTNGGVDSGPLHALADSESGGNGVYAYWQTGFPTQTWHGKNFWVDVVFTPSSGGGDTSAPIVSVSSPAGGSTVSGTISVTANASDNVGVAGVQFRLDGANLGAEDAAAPYTTTWNTTTVANGTHTLSAVARDAAGNAATAASVTVTVNNTSPDTTPPTVSMTVPANGATVSGTAVTVTAAASDNVGVAGVQFRLDGANWGAEDTASPYTRTWDTTTIANGSHTLTAVARDAAGNTTSATVTVTVSNIVSGPPTTVIFTASTDHNSGVTSYLLEIFANGADPNTAKAVASSDLGKPTPAANGDITVDRASFFSALAPGTYVATVSAVGPGGSSRSTPVTFTR